MTRSSGRVLAVRDGKWKYIPQLGSGGFSKPRRRKPRDGEPSVQLYDLSNDIGERKNLAGDRLDVLKRIRTVTRRLTGATGP